MDEPKGINRRLTLALTPADVDRFLTGVDQRGEDECWLWKRSSRNGYGAFKHNKKCHQTHRVAHFIAHGDPGEGMVVMHRCHNPLCCNPAHLKAGTPAENNRDKNTVRPPAYARGEHTHNAVLTSELVANIWEQRKTGLGNVKIARALGVNPSTVTGVLRGKSWKHLMPEWAKTQGDAQ